jgi:hypothetical protein
MIDSEWMRGDAATEDISGSMPVAVLRPLLPPLPDLYADSHRPGRMGGSLR